MANDKDTAGADKGKAKPTKKRGHPFCYGLLLGLVAGIALTWLFLPAEWLPESKLRDGLIKKAEAGADSSRKALADWAEDLADKLRP